MLKHAMLIGFSPLFAAVTAVLFLGIVYPEVLKTNHKDLCIFDSSQYTSGSVILTKEGVTLKCSVENSEAKWIHSGENSKTTSADFQAIISGESK